MSNPLNIFALVNNVVNETLPIQQKGKANRLTFHGPARIEKDWHKALEQGRKLESSINDATYALKAKKQDLLEKISQYLDINTLALDAEFDNPIRSIKLAYDSSHFLQKVHDYTQDIADLQAAMSQNIGMLQSMEANMLGMIQSVSNALANLIAEICNWGLPRLPSIPYLLGGVFHFNGFNFQQPSLFLPIPSFPKGFAFGQCSIVIPNLNIFGSAPIQISSGANTFGTAQFISPLGGMVGDPTQFTVPAYISALQNNKTLPVYNPNTFNPNSSMLGSLPDPNTIISAYQLPPDVYAANIITLNPNLRSVVIEPADPDYNSAIPNPQRAITLRQYLIRFVNLDQIVALNYDPNLMAAWLFYLGLDRVARGGQWLTNLQAAYETLVQPSLTALSAAAVPYNNVLGGAGVVNVPTIPLRTMLLSATPAVRENLLWKLSYIEAGLLGYTRTQNYDSGADATFVSGFTGTDVDYVATTFDATDTQPVTLGQGTAQYPTVANVPKALLATFNRVIAIAATNIAGAPNYQTNLARFKFVYTPFAVAEETDRYTQFWRTLNYNFQQLLAGDPYITNQIVTYVAALDSAIDPLASPDIANQIKSDANSRVRSWVAGTPLLPIPKAPIVIFANNTVPVNDGWNGDTFNHADFLNRPDIQGQPIPIQNAMLRTNLSYAAVLSTKSDLQAAIAETIQAAQGAAPQNSGFHVLMNVPISVPPNIPFVVSFQSIDYDLTGYVTAPNTFTIQTTGLYALSGSVQWDSGQPGVRTLNLVLNGNTVLFSQSTSNIETGPIVTSFSVIQQLSQGDTLQVLIINGTGVATNIIPVTEFYASFVPGAFVSPNITNVPNTIFGTPTAVNLAAGTAVYTNANGDATPVDPVNGEPGSPPTPPFVDGITTTATTAGDLAAVATRYGYEFTISGANFIVGGLVYVGPGGVLIQDYNALIQQVNWIVVVGRAVAPDVLLFQPQLPQRAIDSF